MVRNSMSMTSSVSVIGFKMLHKVKRKVAKKKKTLVFLFVFTAVYNYDSNRHEVAGITHH